MVATVNPCGFAMLPAYLGLFIGGSSRSRSALVVGISVSMGLVVVFVTAGILVASGVRAVVAWIPWMAALVGIGLVVVGVAELRGVHVFARLPGVGGSPRNGSFFGLVGFGASYGIASLSCTLPIFLSLIAGAVAGRSFIESLSVFLSYGAGMSLVVIVLTTALAVGRERVVRTIRPLAAHVGIVSGWLLILAGGFIVWYWATVLSSGAATLGASPIVRTIERIAAFAAGLASADPLLTALTVAGLGIVGWWSIRRVRTDDQEREGEMTGHSGS
jgi:cytochrome c biogenesis protein CcdA